MNVSAVQVTRGDAADGQPLTVAVIPPHIENEHVAKFTAAVFVEDAMKGAHINELARAVGLFV
jgi:hypothetical protein